MELVLNFCKVKKEKDGGYTYRFLSNNRISQSFETTEKAFQAFINKEIEWAGNSNFPCSMCSCSAGKEEL